MTGFYWVDKLETCCVNLAVYLRERGEEGWRCMGTQLYELTGDLERGYYPALHPWWSGLVIHQSWCLASFRCLSLWLDLAFTFCLCF